MYELRIYFKDLFFNIERKKALEVFFSSKKSKYLNYVLIFNPEPRQHYGDINIFVVSKNDKEQINFENLKTRYLVKYENFTSLIEKFDNLCTNVEKLFSHKFTLENKDIFFKSKKENFILVNILLYFSSDKKQEKLLDFIENNLNNIPDTNNKQLNKELVEIFELLNTYELDKKILVKLLKNIDKITCNDILRELKRFKSSPKIDNVLKTQNKSFFANIFSNDKNAVFLPKGFKVLKK